MLAAILGPADGGLGQEGLSRYLQTSICGYLGQDRNAVPGMRTQDLEHRRVPNTPQLHQAKVGTQHPSFVGCGEGQPMVLALHFPKASESQTPPERGADSGR